MSNNYIPMIGIIFSIFIIIWGFVNYLNISPFNQSTWILTNAIITKIDNKNNKTIIKYNYSINDLEYSATISIDKLKNNLEDKTLPIYYYYKNPQLSFIDKPNEGVYTIAFGILLLLLCVILLMNQRQTERELDSLTNKIFTKSETFTI